MKRLPCVSQITGLARRGTGISEGHQLLDPLGLFCYGPESTWGVTPR